MLSIARAVAALGLDGTQRIRDVGEERILDYLRTPVEAGAPGL